MFLEEPEKRLQGYTRVQNVKANHAVHDYLLRTEKVTRSIVGNMIRCHSSRGERERGGGREMFLE